MDEHALADWQMETLRRSVAMTPPGQLALSREEALELINELQLAREALRRRAADPPS